MLVREKGFVAVSHPIYFVDSECWVCRRSQLDWNNRSTRNAGLLGEAPAADPDEQQ